MRKKKVANTPPLALDNVEKRREEKSVLSASSGASSQQSSTVSCSPNSVRFSVLGIAGITVNSPHLEKLQKLEGGKESSYFSSPSKMKSVVTITSDNKVVGITDLSKPLTPAHTTFQKESGEHRHLAFWANEQELTLGSGINLLSSGAETFHMTIGLTDGILPAMPIGTACLVLDAKQMMEDGRIAAVLDLPIQTAADKKMISVDSHVATNPTKKKKKKWFTRSAKEPSKPQQIDFHSVYSTDKTGDAILRIQIHLKAEEAENSVETTVDNTVESESGTSDVKSGTSDVKSGTNDVKSSSDVQRRRSAEVLRNPSPEEPEVQRRRSAEVLRNPGPNVHEVQRNRTADVERNPSAEVQQTSAEVQQTSAEVQGTGAEVQRTTTEVQRNQSAEIQHNPKREVKHNLVDLDESVASESTASIEDNILESNFPGADKGISIEEYNMFQVLAQKRATLDKGKTGALYDTRSRQKQEETKEPEGTFAGIFRGAMDMAISNFFSSSQPSHLSGSNPKADTGPQEEGIEISLPSLTRIHESISTLNYEDGEVKYSLETPIIRPTEEVHLVPTTSMKSQKTEVSNSILAGTDNHDEPKKALTAREQMVQNLGKKTPPSNFTGPSQALLQEEKQEDSNRLANEPLHTEATGRALGLPPSGRQPAASGLPPRPGGRPPRPTTTPRPPLPPTQLRTRGRERDPNIPTSIMAGPINKSWTLLDDDTYTLTMEGSFQVAPGNGRHETKEGEPGLYGARETRVTQGDVTGLDRLFQCGQPEDASPSLGGKEIAKLQAQAMKTHNIKTPKKTEEDEVSQRVPAVIIQYDHMSVMNDDLTVDTRDFTPLRGKDGRRLRNGTRRQTPRTRTMKKRPNRTIGPDDESAGSAEDSISAFIKEVDMQLFDEDEVESLLQI